MSAFSFLYLKYATIPLKRHSLEHLFWNDYKEIDRKTLFFKILQYEKDYYKKLKQNFSDKEIKKYLNEYKPFNKYHKKRYLILKNLFFNELPDIKELSWIM